VLSRRCCRWSPPTCHDPRCGSDSDSDPDPEAGGQERRWGVAVDGALRRATTRAPAPTQTLTLSQTGRAGASSRRCCRWGTSTWHHLPCKRAQEQELGVRITPRSSRSFDSGSDSESDLEGRCVVAVSPSMESIVLASPALQTSTGTGAGGGAHYTQIQPVVRLRLRLRLRPGGPPVRFQGAKRDDPERQNWNRQTLQQVTSMLSTTGSRCCPCILRLWPQSDSVPGSDSDSDSVPGGSSRQSLGLSLNLRAACRLSRAVSDPATRQRTQALTRCMYFEDLQSFLDSE